LNSVVVDVIGHPRSQLDGLFGVVLSNPTNATFIEQGATGFIFYNAASTAIAPDGYVYALQANGDLYNASSLTKFATNVKSFAIGSQSDVYALMNSSDLFVFSPSSSNSGGGPSAYFPDVQAFALRSDGDAYVWFAGDILDLRSPAGTVTLGTVKGFALRNDGNGYVWLPNDQLDLNTPSGNIILSGNVKGFGLRSDGCGYMWLANNQLYLNTPSSNVYLSGKVKGFGLRSDGNGYMWLANNQLYLNTPSTNVYLSGSVSGFGLRNDGYGYMWLANGQLDLNTPTGNILLSGNVKQFAVRNDGNGYMWLTSGELYLNTPPSNVDLGNVQLFALRSDGNGYFWLANGHLYLNTPSYVMYASNNVYLGNPQVFALRNDGDGYIWYANGQLDLNTPTGNVYLSSTVKAFALRKDGNGYMWLANGELDLNTPSGPILLSKNVKGFGLREDGYGYMWLPNNQLYLNTPAANYLLSKNVKGFGVRKDGYAYMWLTNDNLYLNTPPANIVLSPIVRGFALRNDGYGYMWLANNEVDLNTPAANVDLGNAINFGLRSDGNGYIWLQNKDLVLNTPSQSQNIDFKSLYGPIQEFLVDGNGNGYFLTDSGDLYENTPSGTVAVNHNIYSFSFGPNGQLNVTPGQSPTVDTSPNWSGNVAATNLNNPQTNSVTFVAGSWVVPSVFGPQGESSSSAVWVGIDGRGSASPTVEQVGTEEDVINGIPTYYAWWEMFSANGNPKVAGEGKQSRISSMTVQAGDSITASVHYITSGAHAGQFQLYIVDQSRPGDQYLTYESSPQTQTPTAKRNMAEWVVEDPGIPGKLGSYKPLAHFEPVIFTNAYAEMNGHFGGIDDPMWQSNFLYMVSGEGEEAVALALSNITANDVTKSSFEVDDKRGDIVNVTTAAGGSTVERLVAGQAPASAPLHTAVAPLERSAPTDLGAPQVVVGRSKPSDPGQAAYHPLASATKIWRKSSGRLVVQDHKPPRKGSFGEFSERP